MGVEQKANQHPQQDGPALTRRRFLEVGIPALTAATIAPSLLLPRSAQAQTSESRTETGGNRGVERYRNIEGPVYNMIEMTYLIPNPRGSNEPWDEASSRLSVEDITPTATQQADYERALAFIHPPFLTNLSGPPTIDIHNFEYFVEDGSWMEWSAPDTSFVMVGVARQRHGVGAIGTMMVYDRKEPTRKLAQSFMMIFLDRKYNEYQKERDPRTLRKELDQIVFTPPRVSYHPVAVIGESTVHDWAADGTEIRIPLPDQGLKGEGKMPDGREIDILTMDGWPTSALVLITQPGYPKRLFTNPTRAEDAKPSDIIDLYPFARMLETPLANYISA